MTIGTDNLFVELRTEWTQLFGEYNWYTFTFIKVEIENDKWTGGASLDIALLGFSAYFRWNYDPSKIDDIKKDL